MGWKTIVIASVVALVIGCSRPSPPEAPPADSGAGLALPAGFAAEVVFEGTGESRELLIRRDGDMFVSLTGIRDGYTILGLRDEDDDHTIDVVRPFFRVTTPPEQKVPRVHIEYFDDYLYAVTNERVVRMPLPPGMLVPTGPVETIVERIPYQASHRGRTLSVDPDGWVYVNIGAPSNACQANPKTTRSAGLDPCPQLERHAGIWRWRGDIPGQSREDGEHFATGIRNAIAQTWDPVHKGLFIGQMGRDRLDTLWPSKFTPEQNAELPAEEFFRVEKGQNFGWPYCYYDPFQERKVLAPEYGGDGRIVGRCSQFENPAVTFPAHYSPASIAFYHASSFPKRYRGGAFVALKGSWNRAPLPQEGYMVAFVPFVDGTASGEWEVFADGFKGFETLYERDNAVYRPQSVAVHPDGSLYVLDNNEGRIWRIFYTGSEDIGSAPNPVKKSDRALLVAEGRGRGAEVYTQYCAACHQPNGGGVPGEFPPLTGTDWVSGDKGRLIRTVLHGMQGPVEIAGRLYDEIMPAHGFLDDEDIAALLTFVRAEFGDGAGPVHDSEVLLVRSSEQRDTPWPAQELETRKGLTAGTTSSGITGAVDIHVHTAPDVVPRSTDDDTLASTICDAGLAAVVLKNHHFQTAARARLLVERYPCARFYGGIVLNLASGGLNANAVTAMADIGGPAGRFVWLPTHDASRIRLFETSGQPVPALVDVLEVAATRNLVLGTGHTPPSELPRIVDAARKAGISQIVITHALSTSVGATVNELGALAGPDVMIELVYLELARNPARLDDYVEAIERLGADHVVLSSDLGQPDAPLPVEGLRDFHALLRDAGVSGEQLSRMLFDNPSAIVGLE